MRKRYRCGTFINFMLFKKCLSQTQVDSIGATESAAWMARKQAPFFSENFNCNILTKATFE